MFLFLIFVGAIFGFIFTVVSPATIFAQYQTVKTAIEQTLYFPFRSRDIVPGNATLVESWEYFDGLTALDELEAWIYQVSNIWVSRFVSWLQVMN